jgi:hypothetical protein
MISEPAGFWVLISVAVVLAGLLSLAAEISLPDSGTIVVLLLIVGFILGNIAETM